MQAAASGSGSAGDAEVMQVAVRLLSGIALRGLALSARPMPLRQFQVLAVLEETGRSTADQVGRALRLTMPATNGLAERLVASGHLVRTTHPYNRAVVTFEVTQRGRDLVRRVMHWRHQELARILDQLGPPQRLAAAGGLRALITAAAGSGYGTGHIAVDTRR